MTTDNLTLTVNLKVCCGAGSHDATLTLTAWGMVEFFTTCFLLPLTVRKTFRLQLRQVPFGDGMGIGTGLLRC